jgi:uncharacterized protein (TIGR03663 family)
LFAIALVALALRTRELDRRPMHADEANQAVKAGELLENGSYQFDPRDHHGPTLYYAALAVALVRGEDTLAELSEISVRLVPAIAGTIAVLLLGVVIIESSPFAPRWPAFAAAAFAAISPPAVYYSRYFIQETLLVAFTLAAIACALRWHQRPRGSWAAATGVCVGLMLATKANSLLFLFAATMAALAVRVRPPVDAHLGRDAAAAVGAALLTAALFYASFGGNITGMRDALVALGAGWRRLDGPTGHEKPWWYYLQLFTWQRNGGLLWQQIVFFALAVAGAGVAVFSRRPWLRAVTIYIGIVAVVLSVAPYKTPWHAVHLVPGFALLAAAALEGMSRRPAGPAVAFASACLALGSLAHQTWRVAFDRPADGRNPYAYVHSAPDVLKVRPLAEAALLRHPNLPIRIISEEYWPLPWYLRGLPQVGYWSTPPADCDGSLLIVSAAQAELVKGRLLKSGNYETSMLGLRPGFICVILSRP